MPAWTLTANYLSLVLLILFALDRLLKLSAARGFMRRPLPPAPETWPSVSLIQPVTRGASGLRENLMARAALEYPGTVQHLLVCDIEDEASQGLCQEMLAHVSSCQGEVLQVEAEEGAIASKVAKMKAGAARAAGEIVCFLDDDVAPPPKGLTEMVRCLSQPGVGGVFGLACYTNWNGMGSCLMSAFVNANALFSYLPLTYLTEPFTLTGHFFALSYKDWQACGGLNGVGNERGDDDHEIARRVRRLGLRLAQTPVIYRVDNELPSLRAYNRQVKRWVNFMRWGCWPHLTLLERFASFITMPGNLLPGLLLFLTIAAPSSTTFVSWIAGLTLFAAAYFWSERRYLPERMPARCRPLLLVIALITPYQFLLMPLAGNVIEWRGQKRRMTTEGSLEALP